MAFEREVAPASGVTRNVGLFIVLTVEVSWKEAT